ncbi:Protein of unknown function [Lactobacillus gigeriorum DSM 23908 = CRBIP 24.85]|uniref:Uncharacterized protein n=1 Tax=Lactobacillus gigeriorum DSM 23908 = CRBIP 24.85 TaxID=1423751 RepID=I7LF29_9LACO|nr:Protein of unknown function [Lactobacillus gigeriorum DSM 23908 = CRBIP 24.85]
MKNRLENQAIFLLVINLDHFLDHLHLILIIYAKMIKNN